MTAAAGPAAGGMRAATGPAVGRMSAATGPTAGAMSAAAGPTTGSRLTGERPQQGVTPDSLLALHAAGYRSVIERLGPGRMLDVGCGQGFESVRFAAPDRSVVGVDYSAEATGAAAGRFGPDGLRVAQMDALALGLGTGTFDWVCSSHLIEHFRNPEGHVAELARVLADDGTAFFLTPNEPADFENPFHLHLFGRDELGAMLGRHFDDVWLGGLDAVEHVKADFAARRAKAAKVLRLDVFDLRHRIPHRWYVAAYTRLLPVAYRLIARDDAGGSTGITADDWFVTDAVDDTTLVLFAVARRPRRPVPSGRPGTAGGVGRGTAGGSDRVGAGGSDRVGAGGSDRVGAGGSGRGASGGVGRGASGAVGRGASGDPGQGGASGAGG